MAQMVQILLIPIFVILFPCLVLWAVRRARILAQWTTRRNDAPLHFFTVSHRVIESQSPRGLNISRLRHVIQGAQQPVTVAERKLPDV